MGLISCSLIVVRFSRSFACILRIIRETRHLTTPNRCTDFPAPATIIHQSTTDARSTSRIRIVDDSLTVGLGLADVEPLALDATTDKSLFLSQFIEA